MGQATSHNTPALDCCCCVCINTSEVGVVERLGQYSRLLTPGWNWIAWPVEALNCSMSTRIQQLNTICETKTRDNVFVEVGVAVQFSVIPEQVGVEAMPSAIAS
uniref:Band 7 domain-containing protein n=1 Tax=Phaeomonas parva TaxID=124430 RepID=A0A7S1UF41_9STRA|mmetsp:Transcript_45341/g.142163  ORF Transcript_45341/g.142163 Transcript_45341/m.142163 type:complete len:104 (+) Transcript_45341:235-546(+)